MGCQERKLQERRPKKATKASWRKFEELVSRIEKALAPSGAVVKSPDHVRDLVTGQIREIDASIRYKIGTIPIFINIECRERSRVEDDRWIEQLFAKKQKIGASSTVAVSSKGFTDSAHKSAKQFGIELRTVSDTCAEEIAEWCKIPYITHTYSFKNIRNIQIIIDEKSESEATLAPDLLDRLRRLDKSTPIVELEGKGISAPDFIDNWQRHFLNTEFDLDHEVPIDSPPVTKKIAIVAGENEFLVRTSQGKRKVKKVLIIVDVTIKIYEAEITRSVKYASSDATLVDVVEFGSPNELIPSVSLYRSDSGEIKLDYVANEPEERDTPILTLTNVKIT